MRRWFAFLINSPHSWSFFRWREADRRLATSSVHRVQSGAQPIVEVDCWDFVNFLQHLLRQFRNSGSCYPSFISNRRILLAKLPEGKGCLNCYNFILIIFIFFSRCILFNQYMMAESEKSWLEKFYDLMEKYEGKFMSCYLSLKNPKISNQKFENW